MSLLQAHDTGLPGPAQPEALPSSTPDEREKVFLPPPEVLRQLIQAPSRRPIPAPTPPPAGKKDRISIGAPLAPRQKGPLELRRDQDLESVPKGRPDAVPQASPVPDAAPAQGPRALAATGATQTAPQPGGIRFPPGRGDQPPGGGGVEGLPAPASTPSSLRNVDRYIDAGAALGLPTGTGRQMGPLFFDPRGADFTHWTNHFKDEVYRNWIIPQAAYLGFKGHVDLEFTVGRDGKMQDVKLLKSSGTPSLDRAAQNALLGSRLLPLPDDYAPDQVTIQVTFYYSEPPPRES